MWMSEKERSLLVEEEKEEKEAWRRKNLFPFFFSFFFFSLTNELKTKVNFGGRLCASVI